jgi:phosphate transport system protein
MTVHLQSEMNSIKQRILTQASLVERNLSLAIKAVEQRATEPAQKVIESDTDIDKAEVSIEEECLKLLALYQPVAIDLRTIITVLKINNDLERVGALAVNIAERALYLADSSQTSPSVDFAPMARIAKDMLRKSLDAMVQSNAEMAHEVCREDDAVDKMNREMYSTVRSALNSSPGDADSWLSLLTVSRCLERVADLATNLAEDIIYLIDGRIIRHTPDIPAQTNLRHKPENSS